MKVTTLTGDKHELEVAPQDTVKHLKVSKLVFKNLFVSKFIMISAQIIYLYKKNDNVHLFLFSRTFEV